MDIYQKELRHAWSAAQKALYNRHYYQQNKDYWVKWRMEHQADIQDKLKKMREAASSGSTEDVKSMYDDLLKSVGGNASKLELLLKDYLPEDAVKSIGLDPSSMLDGAKSKISDYYNQNKDAAVQKTADGIEAVAGETASFGAAVLKELGSRMKRSYKEAYASGSDSIASGKNAFKKSFQSSYNLGIDSIISGAKNLKKSFQSSYNLGMDGIVNGAKNFGKMWKSGFK